MSYKFNPFTGNLDIEGPVLTGSGTVAAAQDGTATVPGINFANDLNTGIYRPGNDQLAISTAGTGRLFIGSSGNVGIGQTNPSGRLEVMGGYVTLRNGASAYPDGISAPIIYGSSGGGSGTFDQTGNLVLQTRSDAGNYSICFVTGDTPIERMRITSTGSAEFGGNVDVGGWKASNNSLEGARIYSAGAVQVNRTSGGGAVFVGRLNNSVTSQITANGNATFKGQVDVDRTGASDTVFSAKQSGATNYALRADGTVLVGGTPGAGTSNVKLNPDGSAYFASNVGIGTSSPSTKLSVIGSSANGIELGQDSNLSTDSSRLFFSTSAGSNAIHSSSGNLRFFTGSTAGTSTGTERMRITSDAKLLFGTSTARTNFNNHNGTAAIQLEGTGSASSPAIISVIQNAGGHPHKFGGRLILGRSDGLDIGSNIIVGADKMVGTISFQGNDGSEFCQAATIMAVVDGTSNYDRIPGRLVFSTTTSNGGAPLERLRISSDGTSTFTGVVQAGGNPDAGAAPGAQLYPTGTLKLGAVGNSGKSIQIYQTDDGSTTPKIEFLTGGSATFAGTLTSTVGNNQYAYQIGDNASRGGLYNHVNGGYLFLKDSSAATQITLNGADGSASFAGQINGTTVGTSDVRFKENIAPAQPQLDDVVALGGLLKNFDWNEDAPVNEEIHATRQLGLIAQEVEEVCPFLTKTIARTKQGAELTPEQVVPAVYEERVVPAVLDESGEVITPETTEQVKVADEHTIPATYEELDDSYKAISHDALIMKLLGAVAELSAEVAALKNA